MADVVPKLCHHKATSRAYVWWNKKRQYLCAWNSPDRNKLYRAFLAKIDAAAALPIPADGEFTVAHLVLHFNQYARGQHPPSDRKNSEADLIKAALRPVVELFGDMLVSEFRAVHLRAVMSHFVDAGRCRNTVNKNRDRTLRAFSWGVEEEHVPPEVYGRIMRVKPLRPGQTIAPDLDPVEPVADEVVDRTLPLLTPIVATMVQLQRLSGIRPGNVCTICPSEIDQKTDAHRGIWRFAPRKHKNTSRKKKLVVVFGPRAQALLKPFLDRPKDKPLFSPAESVAWQREQRRLARKTKVQPSQASQVARGRTAAAKKAPREKFDTDTYHHSIRNAIVAFNKLEAEDAAAANREPNPIPHWFPNQLRHSRATEVRSSHGIEAAQVLLGHSKAAVTEIYAKRDLELAILVALQSG